MEKISVKCRGCLKEEAGMNMLFFSYDGITTFAQILEEVLGFKVIKEETYSDRLCRNCCRILIEFTKFKTNFQQATQYFKNVFTQNLEDSTSHKEVSTSIVAPNSSDNEGDCCDDDKQNIDVPFQNTNSNLSMVLNSDKQSQAKVKQHICLICGEHFKLKLGLQRRKDTVHKTNSWQKKKIKKLADNSNLASVKLGIVHKGSSGNSSQKLCKICKQNFLSEEFDMHFETHKIYVCKTCGHKFIRKTDLNDHEEIHSNICKYVCQHCGKAFKVRTALNKHRRIHTNPREEICDVCGQQFNTRDTLKTHYKLKHLKSKDFECNLCGRAFTLKSTLEKHIERHNPNRKRTYSCNLCDVSYINKYNLSRHHIIKHTPFESRPSCEFCGKKYTKKTDLVRHLRKHQGQNVNSEKATNGIKSDQINNI